MLSERRDRVGRLAVLCRARPRRLARLFRLAAARHRHRQLHAAAQRRRPFQPAAEPYRGDCTRRRSGRACPMRRWWWRGGEGNGGDQAACRMAVLLGARSSSSAPAFGYLTYPPPLPVLCRRPYRVWQPSEAWAVRSPRRAHRQRAGELRAAPPRLGAARQASLSPRARRSSAAEDHRFAHHGGVDWIAMAGARP